MSKLCTPIVRVPALINHFPACWRGGR